jgi:hypothetical protein
MNSASANASTNASTNASETRKGKECNKECNKDKIKCPLTPDSPRTKSIKYDLYIHGGVYQGKKYYGGDHQGGFDYLEAQLNKKIELMTPKEYEEYMEEIRDLDDDYVWRCF